MKEKMILMAIVVVIIVGLLAYYQYVPFWASIVSTGAFFVWCDFGLAGKGLVR